MKKTLLEKLVNRCLNTGAEFSEIFYENKKVKQISLINGKVDNVSTKFINGIGIRVAKDDLILYSSTNNLDEDNLNNEIDELINVFDESKKFNKITIKEEKVSNNLSKTTKHEKFSVKDKKKLLYDIDKIARDYSKKVKQVQVVLYETDQKVEVANSLGKLVKDNRMLTRIYINVIAKEDEKSASSYKTFASNKRYELLDKIDIKKEVQNLAESACKKLDAKPCIGGAMPAIIGPGFGAVIIHEACGHAMEATSVSRNLSVLCNKINTQIANPKLTIIDDGTLEGEWGSLNIDDEGNITQKNILIENGVLKKYLVDYLNSKKMNHEITGSGRRQNYKYAPTSRMNNTYVKVGNDSISDMIKSIKFGIYAKQMGGGSVDPITGNFNFSVLEAYMIRNGKIAEMVEGASLIGNTLDILNKIDMVSDDLMLESGWCGSDSGEVAVTVGQPTIKVANILVGGE